LKVVVRILFVTALYLPCTGGLEIFVDQLATELQRRGHEPSVLTACEVGGTAGPDLVNGVDVIRSDVHDVIAKRDFAGILRVQRETCEVVRDLRPDVIHVHDAAPSLWMYQRGARRPRPPVLMTLHSVMSEHYAVMGAALPGLRTVMRDVDWVTGVSRDVVHDALRLEPSIANRLSLVPTGIRAEVAATPVCDGPSRLLCVGRLAIEKGFDRALLATAILTSRHDDVTLTIAGDGPLRAELTARAHELGIMEWVEFLGAVPHDRVWDHLSDATVVVMPSRFEGLPLVALEAAWAARPVVGIAAPGLSAAVVHGETGLLVDGDEHALAAAIEELLVNRARARVLGAAARRLAEQAFSLSACVDRYVDLYERLSAARGS
jgi:glycogen(starch) synthase